MEFLYDEPISSLSDDLYCRSGMATKCAETLASIKSEQAFVVGLSGSWGSGKTSFINMVKAELANASVPSAVMDFSPWLYSSSEQLIAEFFEELRKVLGLESKSNLAKALDIYAAELAAGGLAVLGMGIPQLAAFNAANPALNALESILFEHCIKKLSKVLGKNDRTLSDLRNEISREMEKRESNIVVIIDDLDRLSNDDICLIFKLVNLTASFPHMTYVLAYDAAVVTKALEEVQGSSGESYLEKIIHLPLQLPLPPKQAISAQLSGFLNTYIASLQTYQLNDSERARISGTFEDLVLTHVNTPRRVKRYINAFSVFCNRVGESICPTDAIGMVSVITFMPQTARWIWRNREELCGRRMHASDGDSTWAAELDQSLQQAIVLDMGSEGKERNVKEALTRLFPSVGRWKKQVSPYASAVSREEGRVANILNLELCYGAFYEEESGRTRLYWLMAEASCDELCEGIVELDSADDLTRLLDLIKVSKPHLSSNRKEVIAQCLLLTAGKIEQGRDSPIFSLAATEKAAKTLGELLVDIRVSHADAVVEGCMRNMAYGDYLGLTWFIRDERRAQLGEGVRQASLSESVFRKLAMGYVECMACNLRAVLRTGKHPACFFWLALDSELDMGKTVVVQARYASDLEIRTLYSGARLSHWYSGSSDGYRMSINGEVQGAPLFAEPSEEEIIAYVSSKEYWQLPEVAKLRVAAFYKLTYRRDELRASFDEPEVTSDAAEELVESWRSAYCGIDAG